jgi:hypothetical protein
MSGRTGKVLIALLAVLALGGTAFGVVQLARANSEEAANDDLARRLEDVEDRLSDAADELEDAESNPVDDLLGSLGEGSGDLDGLFGEGGLDDLLGGGGAGLLDCIAGGDLLSGNSGSGSLDGLLGDIAGGNSGDPQSALEDLFGGLGSQPSSGGNARSQISKIKRQVERVRGLQFATDVDVTFMTPDKLARRAARLFLEDYPPKDARAEGRMLIALGAIPPEMNLRSTVQDLLESQVAGFYVPETRRLYVPGNPGEPLTAIEKTIVAHELDHALADQKLELPVPESPDPSNMDENLATLSLVEGDATLAMQRYSLEAIPMFEQLTMLNDPAYVASQQALEGMPSYLVEQLQFPYLDGLEFTCDLESRGGWRAVNRAYENPPSTSAQILWPERYRRGQNAAEVRAVTTPGPEWRELFDGSFGAANLLWLFKAPGGDSEAALGDPDGRAAAWAGGAVTVWARGPDTALGLALEQRDDPTDLCDSMAEWYDAAFDDDSAAATREGEALALEGGRQDAVLWCSGDEVRLGVGPDLSTARHIVD